MKVARLLIWSVDADGAATGLAYLVQFVLTVIFVTFIGAIYQDLVREVAGQDKTARVAVWLRGHYPNAIPVTLVDIDDRTYRGWDEPEIAPRPKLFSIIDKVKKLQPSVIVVDIDLAPSEVQRSAELESFFRSYAGDDKTLHQSVPLLLVRKLRSDLQRARGLSTYVSAKDSKTDASVTSTPGIAWVSALLDPNNEGIFERWVTFHPICTENPARGLPSVALAAYVLHGRSPENLRRLDFDLQAAARRQCLGESSTGQAARKLDWLNLPSEPVTIPYFFGWPLASTAVFATTDTAAGRRPLVMRLAALDVEAADNLAPDAIENRVVVIGASHVDSQDFHRTPLGLMPGAYILANTIAGAPDVFGASLSAWTKATLFAVAFFATSAVATVLLRGLLATVIVTVLTTLGVAIGIALDLAASTIQEGVFVGLAMTMVFLVLQQGYDLLRGMLSGRRRSKVALLLSDYGLKIFHRQGIE